MVLDLLPSVHAHPHGAELIAVAVVLFMVGLALAWAIVTRR